MKTIEEETARADDAERKAIAAKEAAEARVAVLTTLAEKVDAIRNSIVGMQGFHFSEHAYPLVAALEEAGYPGLGYKIARENLGTLVEQTKTAEARVEAAESREHALGVQVVALRERLALAMRLVDDVKAEARRDDRLRFVFKDALAAFDAVPGDALAEGVCGTCRSPTSVGCLCPPSCDALAAPTTGEPG